MDVGLSDAEAARRLREEGPNELAPAARRPLWRLLLSVLTEPMFGLLLACGALYALLGNAQEAWTLMGFVVVVMAISLVQQQRAERSLHALRELSAPGPRCGARGASAACPAANWCVATRCCWTQATGCRPICACWPPLACRWTNPC